MSQTIKIFIKIAFIKFNNLVITYYQKIIEIYQNNILFK